MNICQVERAIKTYSTGTFVSNSIAFNSKNCAHRTNFYMDLISTSLNKERWLQIFKNLRPHVKNDREDAQAYDSGDGAVGASSTSGYYIPDSDPPLDEMMGADSADDG